MTDEQFNRQGETFQRVLSKLSNEDLQALSWCFGRTGLVETERDKPWAISDIHGAIADLRRDRTRLREITGALHTLGIGR